MGELATRLRRPLLLAVLGAASFGACGGDNCDDGICTEESSARLLDLACGSGSKQSCKVSGDAEQVTGITEDTVGFRLGESGGTVIIPVDAIGTEMVLSGELAVQVLVAAVEEGASPELSAKLTWGSCTACPVDPPPFIGQVAHDYTWVTVVAGQPNAGLTAGTIPADAALTLSGRGIEVADLRTIVRSQEFGCSIAGPLGARR